MQAYLSSGLGSPTSSVNLFLPLPRPRVSNQYQHSSVHYHYHNNNQSKLTLHHHYHRPTPGWGRNGGIFASSSSGAGAGAATNRNRNHQNHYAILGISTTASSTEIKTAYRLLAKKYHPDVCKDSKSGEVFKSIRRAYDVGILEVAWLPCYSDRCGDVGSDKSCEGRDKSCKVCFEFDSTRCTYEGWDNSCEVCFEFNFTWCTSCSPLHVYQATQ